MTCLCLTRNRRQWLPKAIDCFINQTYPYRELLIIADGADVADLVPNDDRIRLVHINRPAEIGEKRNFGCRIAQGAVIAHWDDDDYSAPGRIAHQVGRLLETGKAVTGYRSMRFLRHDGKTWQYTGPREYVVGTSLCYRREWWQMNQFPLVHVGEDKAFISKAWNGGTLDIVSEDLGLMHATIHDGNTSPRQLCGTSWRAL